MDLLRRWLARMDDIIGYGWRIVFDGRQVPAAVLSTLDMTSTIIGGQGLQEQDANIFRWFDQHRCLAAIVRPDHYVYGAFSSVEETELMGLLEKLAAGALAVSPITAGMS